MKTLEEVFARGLYASLPAAGIAGRLFYATDRGILYQDDGADWAATLDIDALSEKETPDAEADYGIIHDASTGQLKKVLLDDWPGGAGAGDSPTDAAYVTSAAHGDLSAEIVIPSLAGSPDVVPASPDANNDEFNASPLDEDWTVSSTADSYDVNTFWPGRVHIRFDGDQTFAMSKAYIPGASTAFSVTVKLHLALRGGPYEFPFVAMGLTSVDDQEGVRLAAIWIHSRYRYDTRFAYHTLSSGSWSADVAALDHFAYQNTTFLHIQRDASSNYAYWFSFDGQAWMRLATNNDSFTVGKVRLEFNMNGWSAYAHMGIDWIRFNWKTL